MIDHLGRIWSTEHGPRGGDELNLLMEGRHYGWPVATYGTQYGRFRWLLSQAPDDPVNYTRPIYAFVPSIGISNLIEITHPDFARWQHDFLIGSLRNAALHRVHLDEGRVAYTERIEIGTRIRDLAQGSDGRIVMWTDERRLIVASLAEEEASGGLLYEACAACHGVDLVGTALGPPLDSIVGRRVGSTAFGYSPALRGMGGRWTEERLDEFLRDPDALIPGTSMAFAGIADSLARRALIAFLKLNE